MEHTIILLGSLVFLIVVICGFLITQLPRKQWFKFILIPLVLAFGIITILNIKNLMGYPFHGVPQGKFYVENVMLNGSNIEFLALENGHSRLYSVPYDANLLSKLKAAIEAERKGTGLTVLQFQKLGRHGLGDEQSLEGKFTPLVPNLPLKPDHPTVNDSPPTVQLRPSPF